MHTVQIYDTTDGLLDFDLRHVLSAIGAQAVRCSWAVSRVGGAYDEPFEATGDQAIHLEELVASGRRIKGYQLRELANGTQQVIWVEFQAYQELGATMPVFVVRAIDSSFYEVAACDPHVLKNLKAAFRDVRQA